MRTTCRLTLVAAVAATALVLTSPSAHAACPSLDVDFDTYNQCQAQERRLDQLERETEELQRDAERERLGEWVDSQVPDYQSTPIPDYTPPPVPNYTPPPLPDFETRAPVVVTPRVTVPSLGTTDSPDDDGGLAGIWTWATDNWFIALGIVAGLLYAIGAISERSKSNASS